MCTGFPKEIWLTPEQAGLTAEEVTMTTAEGDFPAWKVTVPGSDKWAVLTHGRSGDRPDMLRMARPLNAAGYNLLLTTYAGDNVARPAEDGIWHFGVTEWDEIEAAVQYALDQGAQTLVMGAVSLGGAVTDGFLAHSTLADQVDGVILDAPVSSLRTSSTRAPSPGPSRGSGGRSRSPWRTPQMLIAGLRFGLDYDAVDYTDMAGLFDVPLLTFQTSEDQTMPKAVNDRFMTEGSGKGGKYVVVPDAGHVLSWNVDPTGLRAARHRVRRAAGLAIRAAQVRHSSGPWVIAGHGTGTGVRIVTPCPSLVTRPTGHQSCGSQPGCTRGHPGGDPRACPPPITPRRPQDQGFGAIRDSHQLRSSRNMSSPSNSMQQDPMTP